jgi:putative mRNA 3-end processing factor
MAPADMERIHKDHGPFDALITESTYGHRSLPARKELEVEFIEAIKRVIDRGGTVLVPVFALGRSQEILIMLSEHHFDCPIYFDGMAKEVTRKILTNESTYVINKDKLHYMLYDRVDLVAAQDRRAQIAQDQGAKIIITTSGMMQGGPAIAYLKHLWHDPKNAVFLTGYQVHGTNGRHLIDDGYIYIEGWKTPVKCEVQKFDFSGHADIEDIKKAIWHAHPELLIVQHGDEESVENLVAWAKEETPFKVKGPHIGDSIEL